MTEQEWLAGTDPEMMLRFLAPMRQIQGTVSDRKLRLFAAACCRQIWSLITEDRCQRAVAVAESYADGQATADQLATARADARRAAGRTAGYSPSLDAATAAAKESALKAARLAAYSAALALAQQAWDASQQAECTIRWMPAKAAQATLLREIVGDLFRPAFLDPAWLTWNGGLIRQLAEAAYEKRQLPSGRLDPVRLAVLADALEEAGCTDMEILGHLRLPGAVHVRGCHIVDLLLAKE
jgi:hypothetical protein